jgi:hypothetical protein
VNLNFSQTISFRCDDPQQVIDLITEWDRNQAESDIMGYMGTRILADRETPGKYMIIAEFGIVDPDVPAADEAARNNDRPETQAWSDAFRKVIIGEPAYHHYDELYRTDV